MLRDCHVAPDTQTRAAPRNDIVVFLAVGFSVDIVLDHLHIVHFPLKG